MPPRIMLGHKILYIMFQLQHSLLITKENIDIGKSTVFWYFYLHIFRNNSLHLPQSTEDKPFMFNSQVCQICALDLKHYSVRLKVQYDTIIFVLSTVDWPISGW